MSFIKKYPSQFATRLLDYRLVFLSDKHVIQHCRIGKHYLRRSIPYLLTVNHLWQRVTNYLTFFYIWFLFLKIRRVTIIDRVCDIWVESLTPRIYSLLLTFHQGVERINEYSLHAAVCWILQPLAIQIL